MTKPLPSGTRQKTRFTTRKEIPGLSYFSPAEESLLQLFPPAEPRTGTAREHLHLSDHAGGGSCLTADPYRTLVGMYFHFTAAFPPPAGAAFPFIGKNRVHRHGSAPLFRFRACSFPLSWKIHSRSRQTFPVLVRDRRAVMLLRRNILFPFRCRQSVTPYKK